MFLFIFSVSRFCRGYCAACCIVYLQYPAFSRNVVLGSAPIFWHLIFFWKLYQNIEKYVATFVFVGKKYYYLLRSIYLLLAKFVNFNHVEKTVQNPRHLFVKYSLITYGMMFFLFLFFTTDRNPYKKSNKNKQQQHER